MSHSLLCPHSEVSELIEISYPLEQRWICISYIYSTVGYFFVRYQFNI